MNKPERTRNFSDNPFREMLPYQTVPLFEHSEYLGRLFKLALVVSSFQESEPSNETTIQRVSLGRNNVAHSRVNEYYRYAAEKANAPSLQKEGTMPEHALDVVLSRVTPKLRSEQPAENESEEAPVQESGEKISQPANIHPLFTISEVALVHYINYDNDPLISGSLDVPAGQILLRRPPLESWTDQVVPLWAVPVLSEADSFHQITVEITSRDEVMPV